MIGNSKKPKKVWIQTLKVDSIVTNQQYGTGTRTLCNFCDMFKFEKAGTDLVINAPDVAGYSRSNPGITAG